MSAQYCRRAFSRSVCRVAMCCEATLNIVRGLMSGATSLGACATSLGVCAAPLGAALGFGVLLGAGGSGAGGGSGGGVGGSSTILTLGFRGAVSREPGGLPLFFGAGATS